MLSLTILAKLVGANRVVTLRVPGLKAPIELRARTSDVKVFHQVFVDQEHDVAKRLGKVRSIIDAGANVGFSSIFFALEFPDATIIAVEPEPRNYAQLVRNVGAYSNIVPLNAALFGASGVVTISNPDAEEWAFRVDVAAPGNSDATIAAVSVPDILDRYKFAELDILKLDIEGAETEVFAPGCAAWLRRVNFIMIELHDYLKPGCSAAVLSAANLTDFSRAVQGEYTILARRSKIAQSAVPSSAPANPSN
ncbi:MAG TPA: FkbM family methyltransferase [Gemmatimonadaceae bacterium]|nr:FkbM family methyltransferase [Gemmatimonadaceae bacterium]